MFPKVQKIEMKPEQAYGLPQKKMMMTEQVAFGPSTTSFLLILATKIDYHRYSGHFEIWQYSN